MSHVAKPKLASPINQDMTVKEKLRRALLREKAGLSDLPLIGGEAKNAIALRKESNLDESEEDEEIPEAVGIPVKLPPKAAAIVTNIETDKVTAMATEDENTAMPKKNKKKKNKKRKAMEDETMTVGDECVEVQVSQHKTLPAAEKKAKVRPACVVHVKRDAELQASRQELPIAAMEQEVMESISGTSTVVICGETGSGKTTQLPQFLYEAGYGCSDFQDRAGMIAVTQPRRVAVLSTARRVAVELGVKIGAVVGYQVRYERAMSNQTRVKFMTDGILLREIQQDFLLKKYSIIIIDEAHERSVNTDILLGLLSRVVPLREKYAQQVTARNALVHECTMQ